MKMRMRMRMKIKEAKKNFNIIFTISDKGGDYDEEYDDSEEDSDYDEDEDYDSEEECDDEEDDCDDEESDEDYDDDDVEGCIRSKKKSFKENSMNQEDMDKSFKLLREQLTKLSSDNPKNAVYKSCLEDLEAREKEELKNVLRIHATFVKLSRTRV